MATVLPAAKPLIRQFREQLGLSQEALARTVDIPLRTLARYERGMKHPRLETAVKIAAALGVTIADLFPLEEAAS